MWPATSRTTVWASKVVIDRDTAGRLGITPQNVDDVLYDAFGQRQVSTIYTQSNQFHVILEAAPQWQQNADRSRILCADRFGLGQSGFHDRSGRHQYGADGRRGDRAGADAVRSRRFRSVPTPITINHQGQFPVVTLSFNLAPGASLGDAVRHIRKATTESRHAGQHRAHFPGHGRGVRNSLANESLLILAAIVTVYIVLGVLYESYIHPITILSTLPSAGVGAIAALILFQRTSTSLR